MTVAYAGCLLQVDIHCLQSISLHRKSALQGSDKIAACSRHHTVTYLWVSYTLLPSAAGFRGSIAHHMSDRLAFLR